MRKFVNYLFFPLKCICYLPIMLYKLLISPILPHTCRYTPTCSSYALGVLAKFGFFKGIFLTIRRLFRCTPNGDWGYDPVPLNIKGDYKWLI